MEGVVLERSSVLGARSDASLVEELLREVRELRREAAELRQEVAELRAENLELRQQVGYWKEMHRRAADRAAKLELDVDRLQGENRLLQARLFGSRTEQTGTNRSSQLEGVDDDQPAQPVRGRGQTRGRPGPRRRDHGHLPVVEESRELSAEQLACPQCGIAATPSGSADSEVLEVEVRAYRRRIRRSRYQRTCRCGCVPRTLTASVAPKLILKGSLGISIWARLLTGKFLGHQPISRQLKQWRLQGLNLSPGTIGGGFQRLEPLFGPVYEALLKRGSLASLAQADETRWLMFVDHEDKVGHRWWLWAFLTQDAVVFRLDPPRSHAVPEQQFRDSDSLVVMVDRYSAYKAMAPVKEGRIRLDFCWAHVRRDFIEVAKGWAELRPWAIVWLRRIHDLYRAHRQRQEHPWKTSSAIRRPGGPPNRRRDAGAGGPGTIRRPTPSAVSEGIGQSKKPLGRTGPVRGRSADPARQQRRGAGATRSCGGTQELLWLGGPVERPTGSQPVLDFRHVGTLERESREMAAWLPRSVCRKSGASPR